MNNISNIEDIYEDINDNYSKLKSTRLLNPGVNSLVYKLIFSDMKLAALKIYPKSKGKPRERQSNESKMLELLHESGIFNCPKVLYLSKKYNFSIISWIEGKQIIKPNDLHFNKICNFTRLINSEEMRKNSYNVLQDASEAYFSIESILNNIKNKVASKENDINSMDNSEEKTWLINSVIKESYVLLDKTRDQINSCQTMYYPDIENKVISQSDVGFHNILENKRSLYFIDFEYGGWDNPKKTISDWILQPDCKYTFKKDLVFYDQMASALGISKEWKNDINIYLELYRVRWSMIILNKYFKLDREKIERNKLLNKLKSYLADSRLYLNSLALSSKNSFNL